MGMKGTFLVLKTWNPRITEMHSDTTENNKAKIVAALCELGAECVNEEPEGISNGVQSQLIE